MMICISRESGMTGSIDLPKHIEIHPILIDYEFGLNLATFFIKLVVVVSLGNVPLTIIELLWVNLIMDMLQELERSPLIIC